MKVVLVVVLYLLLSVAFAFASPVFGSRDPGVLAWYLMTLFLFAAIVVLLYRSLSSAGRFLKIVKAILVGGIVGGIATLLGLVLMVNIWGYLGLGH